MIAWLVVGCVLVAGGTVGALLAIEMVSLSRDGSILHVGVRRRPSPEAPTWLTGSIDMGEGALTYLLVVALAWLTGLSVANSAWVLHSDILPMVCVAATLSALVLAKAAPRATAFWLAAEVTAVAALFISTAAHTGARVDQDFVTWVLAVRVSLQLALLVAMVAAAWLSCAWLVFWTLRRRNVPLALAPMIVTLAVELLDDPGQKGLPCCWRHGSRSPRRWRSGSTWPGSPGAGGRGHRMRSR